jgi:hypothetical protein
MKLIPLTQNQFAQVDDSDFYIQGRYKWYAQKSKDTYYAIRHKRIDGKLKCVLLHREIMNTPDDMQVDHGDHNGLNCQRYNMTNCTVSQNQMNCLPHGKSKYIGVSFMVKGTRTYIRAEITVNKKRIRLGLFKTEEDAARKRDEYAKLYHGKFANLNFPLLDA